MMEGSDNSSVEADLFGAAIRPTVAQPGATEIEVADRKQIKIVAIISFMNVAGAQEALMRLGKQLRLRGHDVEVWFLYRKEQMLTAEPFTRVFLEKSEPSLTDYVRLLFRVRAALRDSRPNAVLGFLPLGNSLGLTAAMMAGVR